MYLSDRFKGSFEIILIPNPVPGDTKDHTQKVAEKLARLFTQVRVAPHRLPLGKGAALKTGFLASRGDWIFFTDADLPYDLDFFSLAAQKFDQGFDLVTGNRRLPTSYFDVPVKLLRLAYSRHRLGRGFNRVVRFLFPIPTTDTQAGIKALSRRLATQVFQDQICPGFFFDLEIFLSTLGHGYFHTELPVTLHLRSEKSTVRILRECLSAAYWLFQIWIRYRLGHYGLYARAPRVLHRFSSAPLGIRTFLKIRWNLTPYSRMISKLPPLGSVLDLGCGHGLLSLTLALRHPSRRVLGIDHDQERVNLAQKASRGVRNLEISQGSILEMPGGKFSAVTLIDVMHYFEPEQQEKLLRQVHQGLESGGTLLLREVDPSPGILSTWNRVYEWIATHTRFTRSEKMTLHFRSPREWERLLKRTGFRVRFERCSSALFSDVLFISERAS